MSLVCQNGCFDRDPMLVAVSTRAVWLKCSECGKLNIRFKQENRGGVVHMGGDYRKPLPVIECHGEIPDHMLPSFWAMGRYVMPGLTGLKLDDEDKRVLTRTKRRAHVTGPCTCGREAAPSLIYENEVERCGLCGGPVCVAGTRQFGERKRTRSGGICCACMDGCLT